MHPADCLGLVLAWSRTQGSLMVLQLIFGLTMPPVSKYLQFARRILVKILKANELPKICVPTHEKLEEYKAMIQARHSVLDNVWGTMDGLKVRIEQAPNEIVQSRFYKGWKSNHFVTGVWVLSLTEQSLLLFTTSLDAVMTGQLPTGVTSI